MNETLSKHNYLSVLRRTGAALAAIAVTSSCSTHAKAPSQPSEFAVNSFTYSPEESTGKVTADETFPSQVSTKAAAAAMVSILNNSDYELRTFFPDVPLSITNGDYQCTVTDRSVISDQYSYDLLCTAYPKDVVI